MFAVSIPNTHSVNDFLKVFDTTDMYSSLFVKQSPAFRIHIFVSHRLPLKTEMYMEILSLFASFESYHSLRYMYISDMYVVAIKFVQIIP